MTFYLKRMERDSKSSTQTIADIFSSSGKVKFLLRMKICRAFNIIIYQYLYLNQIKDNSL